MLVLTRKREQRIQIGENISITILQIKGSSVRLGIDAPSEVRVMRAELEQADDTSGDRSAQKAANSNAPSRRASGAAGPCDQLPSAEDAPTGALQGAAGARQQSRRSNSARGFPTAQSVAPTSRASSLRMRLMARPSVPTATAGHRAESIRLPR